QCAVVAMPALLLVSCFDTQSAPTAIDSGTAPQITDPFNVDADTLTRMDNGHQASVSDGTSGSDTSSSTGSSTTPEQSVSTDSANNEASDDTADDTADGTSDGASSDADTNENPTSETGVVNATSPDVSWDVTSDGGTRVADSSVDSGVDGGADCGTQHDAGCYTDPLCEDEVCIECVSDDDCRDGKPHCDDGAC